MDALQRIGGLTPAYIALLLTDLVFAERRGSVRGLIYRDAAGHLRLDLVKARDFYKAERRSSAREVSAMDQNDPALLERLRAMEDMLAPLDEEERYGVDDAQSSGWLTRGARDIAPWELNLYSSYAKALDALIKAGYKPRLYTPKKG